MENEKLVIQHPVLGDVTVCLDHRIDITFNHHLWTSDRDGEALVRKWNAQVEAARVQGFVRFEFSYKFPRGKASTYRVRVYNPSGGFHFDDGRPTQLQRAQFEQDYGAWFAAAADKYYSHLLREEIKRAAAALQARIADVRSNIDTLSAALNTSVVETNKGKAA